MKVIYCVSELHDWLDVAKHFEEEKNWQPLLWITTNKNKKYAKEIFPYLSSIDFFEANRGNFKNLRVKNKKILSDKIIFEYSKDEKIALKMMDRMDPDGYSFNYSERIQLYYRTLEFILNYFNDYNPELIFFYESPHSLFTYIMYAVALKNNIKILRLSPTHINGNVFLTSSLEKTQPFLEKAYLLNKQQKVISQEVLDYIDAINGKYDNATPYYMEKIKKANRKSDLSKLSKMFFKSIEYLFRTPKQNYYKSSKNSIKKQFSNYDLAKVTFQSTKYKIKLQKEYQKYVDKTLINFNLDDKFIYFPLQYQPEKSSSPEADIFVEQYLAINMLSKLSNGRFKIYIKEHISQFSIRLNGEQGRVLSFYEDLFLLENVVFIDTNIDSFLLIDNAICLSTLTGTAGFESVIRGKPSIIFGYPWYKDCEGIYKIDSIETLNFFLNIIDEKKYTLELENVKYFLESIFSISKRIYLNSSNNSSIKDEKHNNVKEIINLIKKYENEVM